jgi:hypothetical protein
MANTLAANLTAISQAALDVLQRELPPFGAFTTNFNSDIAQEGDAVSTRIATAPASADLSGGYTAVDQTVTAKTVTLSNFKGLVVGFTDLQWSKASYDLMNLFVVPGVRAVVNDIFDDVNNLVTNANYSQKETIAAAAFDSDSLATLAKDLTAVNVPKADRHALLNSTYYLSLAKDSAIKAAYAYGGTEAIRDNRIPRVHGFSVHELSTIDSTPNAQAENLVGWVCTPQAILIAARAAAVPENFPGEVMNFADPMTGLPLQLRKWYDADSGLHKMSIGCIWGTQVGNASCLYRVVSA